MKFIGRQTELRTLETEYGRDSSFTVIYGRFRIGKTTLIKEFIKDKTFFYFLAAEEIESQSMNRFAGVISRATGNPALLEADFSDWLDLFRAAAHHKPMEKKILILDEFPYLVRANGAFPSILQKAWDEILKESNVMLILCGSLIGMMQKHPLSYDSPLYRPTTTQIHLMPLPFPEVYAAQSLPFEYAVEQYAITGGVPKYLEFFSDGEPLLQQVKSFILSKNSFLYEEPNVLLKGEIVSAINYISIIKVIADGNHTLGQIAHILGAKTSALTPYFSTLIDLGFIIKETPITEKNPEKSRRGLYFISHNFLRFWFYYVYPFKGELELDNFQIVLEEICKSFPSKFIILAYRNICRDIFAHLCKRQDIPFVPTLIGAHWRSGLDKSTGIDLMAADHQNKLIFAGECTYHCKPVDTNVYDALCKKVRSASKIQTAFPGYKIIFGLFSKSGFTQRLLDISHNNPELILINEDHVIK